MTKKPNSKYTKLQLKLRYKEVNSVVFLQFSHLIKTVVVKLLFCSIVPFSHNFFIKNPKNS